MKPICLDFCLNTLLTYIRNTILATQILILINLDMIGQQRIVTFSFTSNVENEENLNKLISNVKQYTKRVKAEYIDKLEITEIILIF